MTQEEAAARIGVSRTTMWRLESGRQMVAGAHLERAARVYRVSQKWILHGPLDVAELQERLVKLERAVDGLHRRQGAVEEYLGIGAAAAVASASGRR